MGNKGNIDISSFDEPFTLGLKSPALLASLVMIWFPTLVLFLIALPPLFIPMLDNHIRYNYYLYDVNCVYFDQEILLSSLGYFPRQVPPSDLLRKS